MMTLLNTALCCVSKDLFQLLLELQEREIPEDDPRLILVSRAYENMRLKFGTGPGRT